MFTFQEYLQKKSEGYTHVPLVMELFADLDTPLSLYLKLANQPMSYLLESVEGGERFARYSFIGLPCHTYLKINGNHVDVYRHHKLQQSLETDPLAFIEQFQATFKTPEIVGLPRFTGGLVGYFGYETVHFFEPNQLGKRKLEDMLNVPDILLMLSTELAVIDNLSGKIYLIVYADTKDNSAYHKARQRLEDIRISLRQSITIPLSLGSLKAEPQHKTDAETFKQWVDKIHQYIVDGDCMQVVPSQRTYIEFKDNPLSLYRALRSLNPSPYMFYYDFGDFHVIGASPEILVRQEGRQVTVRPLAGTRKRGRTPTEDKALEQELLADEKEIAEHVMLIDLGRNDLGRISQAGSVKVTDKMVVERYSHVMHIVSNVEGYLKEGISNLEVLSATFPAGTLSGAPKIRAMQIIEELEPCKRGIYSGAVGYLGFNGDMDVCIAIRTAVVKDDMVYVQSGAGIVADSDRNSEWQETQNKAMAVIQAVYMVQNGLDS